MADICQGCQWFLVNAEERGADGQILGWCRRYPPTRTKFKRIINHGDAGPVEHEFEESSFPVVQFDWYCGEWLAIGRKVHQDLLRPSANYSFKPAVRGDG